MYPEILTFQQYKYDIAINTRRGGVVFVIFCFRRIPEVGPQVPKHVGVVLIMNFVA